MNMPKNTIEAPSLETIEAFGDIVVSISDEARRALNAVSVVATIEAASAASGIGILEIPATIARIAKCRPRDDLLEFDSRSASFVFRRPADGETYATVMRFVTEFAKWAAQPLVVEALGKAENHRQQMFEARRVA